MSAASPKQPGWPSGKPVERRNFLTILVSVFAALWGLMTLYPIYRYLRPPKEDMAESTVTTVIVGAAADIPVGSGQNFQFGNIPAILTHPTETEFYAFNAICTHLGCTVRFRPDMDRIWCACHGGIYDPVTGRVLAGPPPRPLAKLKAEVINDNVVVSRA